MSPHGHDPIHSAKQLTYYIGPSCLDISNRIPRV
jgi:hypothetical protein